MSLQGKVAAITGGSSGIGASIVRALAAAGAAVTLDYHTHRDSADAIASDIVSSNGKAFVVQADISNVASAQGFIAQTVQQYGQLDILVNNAGIEEPTSLENVTEEQWDQQMSVNLKGAFFATQAAWRQFVAQGRGGVIINISSVHETLPMVGNAVYCASKGGLRMLTRALAPEIARSGVRIVNVGPGAVATPINESTLEDPVKKRALLAEIPLGRIGAPADIASAVTWLASDDASYITGTTLFVDGGLLVNAGSL